MRTPLSAPLRPLHRTAFMRSSVWDTVAGRVTTQMKNGIMHSLLLSAAIFDILESSSEVLTVLKSLL